MVWPNDNPLTARAKVAELEGRTIEGPPVGSLAVTAFLTRDGEAGHKRIRGELEISERQLGFVPFRDEGEVTHRSNTVIIERDRRRPPWSNTFLLLDDRNVHLRVRVPRREVLRRLRRTELSVVSR